MNYSGFYEFPFPSKLSEEDNRIKNFFLALSDEEQLNLLNGCESYENFYGKVSKLMRKRYAAR